MKAKSLSTGIPGLDSILNGGLPAHRLYLVQGEPGAGKTTLALQFLLEGTRKGEKSLYISFSETEEELKDVSGSHGWNLDGISLLDLSSIRQQLLPEAQNTVFHPSQVEMNQMTKLIMAEVEKFNPSRIVFDSVSEMRMLADTPLRYRRQMLGLKQFFSGKNSTVVFLDDLTSAPGDLQVQSVVHGVICLQKLQPEFGDERRRLHIAKLRGLKFKGGSHDYVIRSGGLQVFPRMISAESCAEFQRTAISSGIKELDQLLGGGLDRGTSNLFLGPAGTGKSTLALQYALTSAERGEKAMIFIFEESLATLIARASTLGMDIKKHLKSGCLQIRKIDPAELSPGEFADAIRTEVLNKKLHVIVIDSLNGYLHSMPQEHFLSLQLHELLAFLGNHGVTTILVLAQQGLMGMMMNTPVDVTYLADTVLITRYFEARGAVKKAISIIKKRGGFHESTIREFSMGKQGVIVGPPLGRFHGVLTGVPQYHGDQKAILED